MSEHDADATNDPVLGEILQRVERVIDESVRPELVADGGDIEVVGIDEDRIVQVRFLGSCNSCSASMVYTLTMTAEKAVKQAIPEVRLLEAVH